MYVHGGVCGTFEVYKNGVHVRTGKNLFLKGFFNKYNAPLQDSMRLGGVAVGQGRHSEVTESITALKQVYQSAGSTKTTVTSKKVGDVYVISNVASTTVPKGEAWVLRELGMLGGGTLYTYALIKAPDGSLDEIPVDADEVLTVTYTVQIQLPAQGPWMAIEVNDGRGGSRDLEVQFVFGEAIAGKAEAYKLPIGYYKSTFPCSEHNGKGNRGSVGVTGGVGSWAESEVNGAWSSIVQTYAPFPWGFNFRQPLVKTGTQTLTINTVWNFQNVTPL